MPSIRAQAFAEKAKTRDLNRVLAPALFGERGLGTLHSMIIAHGIEALDLAVRDFIARSKMDRAIRRGHVRTWRFFGPYISEQSAKENAPCED